jgi:hypothetical protein
VADSHELRSGPARARGPPPRRRGPGQRSWLPSKENNARALPAELPSFIPFG